MVFILHFSGFSSKKFIHQQNVYINEKEQPAVTLLKKKDISLKDIKWILHREFH